MLELGQEEVKEYQCRFQLSWKIISRRWKSFIVRSTTDANSSGIIIWQMELYALIFLFQTFIPLTFYIKWNKMNKFLCLLITDHVFQRCGQIWFRRHHLSNCSAICLEPKTERKNFLWEFKTGNWITWSRASENIMGTKFFIKDSFSFDSNH